MMTQNYIDVIDKFIEQIRWILNGKKGCEGKQELERESTVPQDKIRNTDLQMKDSFRVERALRLRLGIRIIKGNWEKATFTPGWWGIFHIKSMRYADRLKTYDFQDTQDSERHQ